MESGCDYGPELVIDSLPYHDRYSDPCLPFEVSASASDHIHAVDRLYDVVLHTLASRRLSVLVAEILDNLETWNISIIQGRVHPHSIVYPAASYSSLERIERSCNSHPRGARRRTWWNRGQKKAVLDGCDSSCL